MIRKNFTKENSISARFNFSWFHANNNLIVSTSVTTRAMPFGIVIRVPLSTRAKGESNDYGLMEIMAHFYKSKR
ncbi:MAG: hypothetical protein CVU45_07055 [Chloroflexi bacterium HGW-Chloroflexi-7]|nr:MAG: hypothetical protein CVU45_07055 [Chloroflexi bacterium HGW-Chloroflexi-7]